MEPTPPPSGSAHLSDDALIDLTHGLREPVDSPESLDHLKRCAGCESRLRFFASERARLLVGPRPFLTPGGIELAAIMTPPAGAGGGQPHGGGRLLPRLLKLPLISLGLAAAALVIVFFAFRPGSAPKREAYWLPPPSEEALRSDSGTWASSPEVAEALRAYARHDVADALARFRSLPSEAGSDYFDSLRGLYLASLLAATGADGEAQEALSSVDVNSLPEPWRGRARYVLQMTYRHQGRSAPADSLLRLLSGQPGELGERARDELGR